MGKSIIETLEMEELVEKLVEAGHGHLIDILLNNNKSYTKKSRLNKSSTCRSLGWKSKQLEDALAACREVLKNEFPN